MTTLFLIAGLIVAEPSPREHRCERVGQLIIRGNVYTENAAILDVLHENGFYPGVVLPSRLRLLCAEIELNWKFRDRFAWLLGNRPAIRILPEQLSDPNDPPSTVFRDIEIRFPESMPKVVVGPRLLKD